MDRLVQALFFAILLASTTHAEQSLVYEISVRQGDEEVQTVQVEIDDGQIQAVDIEGGLKVELTAEAIRSESEDSVTVRLMRRANLEVLHTARHSLLGTAERRIAYVVCGDNVTYLSPAPSDIPMCAAQS